MSFVGLVLSFLGMLVLCQNFLLVSVVIVFLVLEVSLLGCMLMLYYYPFAGPLYILTLGVETCVLMLILYNMTSMVGWTNLSFLGFKECG